MQESPRLVTFGETMLRLGAPNGQRLETAETFDVHVGGAESNVAVAAQRLGLDATWCSRLPDSPLGDRVVNEIRRHGVSVEVDRDETARQGIYFLDAGGEPRGTEVLYDRAHAAITTTRPDDLPLELIRGADAFLTTGITPALSEPLRETTTTLFAAAVSAGTTTVFDVNYRSKLWDETTAGATFRDIFPDIDVLTIASRDARQLLDLEGEPTAIADYLHEEYDLEVAIVTVGAEGVVAVSPSGTHEQEVIPAETVDPIGTGDAFLGGFLAWYLEGADVDASLAAGAATASIKRTVAGDMVVVTRDEVETVVDGTGADIDR